MKKSRVGIIGCGRIPVVYLRAGCHVLAEKPVALSLPDAGEMIKTAQACGKQLGVIFQNRYTEGAKGRRGLLNRAHKAA